jgi:hypothetical protein
MYVHAWQSYIWNRILSERVKLFGAKEPVEGDLVYADEGEEEEAPVAEDGEDVVVEAETRMSPSPPSSSRLSNPVFLSAEVPAVADASSSSTAANPQLAHFIATSKVRKVRALTAADIASKKYSVYDVVLPMPGFAVTYPAGQLGELYKRVMKEDGIDADDMWRKQKEYSLVCLFFFPSFPSFESRPIPFLRRAVPTAKSFTSPRTFPTASLSPLPRTRTSPNPTRTASSTAPFPSLASTRKRTAN